MRLVSIFIALLVAATLYLLTFERQAVLDFAGRPGAEEAAPPAAADAAPEDPTASVSVVAIRSSARMVDGAVALRGRTEAARQVDVQSETSGKIVGEPLRKGSFVEAGQILCRLDPGTREVQLAEAEASLAEARAAPSEARARLAEAEALLAEARINQNAAARLSEGGFASQTRLASADAAVESGRAGVEAAQSGLQSAEARIRSAEAAVAAAEREIERTEIHAPFSGLLETDTAELGALLQPGGHCATVISLDPITLVGFVPETSVAAIETGAEATARIASGQTVTGTVTFLSRAADPETRTFRTEIEVANPDLSIRDGQTAEIAIRTEGRPAHLLPQSALTLNDAGTLGVRVVAENGTAAFRPVDLLRDSPEGVYVAGLDAEAGIVVLGQEYVSDGVALDVTWREAGG